MRPIRYLIPLLLLASSAMAQNAVLIQLPNGSYIGIATAPDGTQIVLTNVTILKLPDPPAPPATATHAMLLMETGDASPATTLLIAGIRNNPELSKKLTILDPDTEDQDGNPDKQVQAALLLLKDTSLPAVVGFGAGADGKLKPVVFAKLPNDAKVADVVAALKKWGL